LIRNPFRGRLPKLRGPRNLPFIGQAFDYWRDPGKLIARGLRVHGERFRFVLAGRQVTVGLDAQFQRAFLASDALTPLDAPGRDHAETLTARWGNQGEIDLFDALSPLAAWTGVTLLGGAGLDIAQAVQEAERRHAPMELLKRTALADCKLDGVEIRAGQLVMSARFGSAEQVVELWARILRDFEIDLLEAGRIRYRRRVRA
jgi:hypothetical protein